MNRTVLSATLIGLLGNCFFSCKQKTTVPVLQPKTIVFKTKPAVCGVSNIPARFGVIKTASAMPSAKTKNHQNMVRIDGGSFMMGGDNQQASADEFPKHKVTVNGYWIDQTEVTNAQFAKFVKATGYITTAERKPDWEQLKKQLPPGTPKPDEALLVPASLVFTPTNRPVSLADYSQMQAGNIRMD
jgi:sulfatase modifying factor 1